MIHCFWYFRLFRILYHTVIETHTKIPSLNKISLTLGRKLLLFVLITTIHNFKGVLVAKYIYDNNEKV